MQLTGKNLTTTSLVAVLNSFFLFLGPSFGESIQLENHFGIDVFADVLYFHQMHVITATYGTHTTLIV